MPPSNFPANLTDTLAKIEISMAPFYLEDFTPGWRIKTSSYTLGEDEMVAFARKYDPQPFHLDAEAAEKSFFGGLVASGFQSAALTWKLATETGIFKDSGIAGIGIDELHWLHPLHINDTVTCTLEVLANHPSTSKPDRGSVVIRYDLDNHDGRKILTLKLTQILLRRPKN
ncbi:MaoC/PaaZ C-terminal domain-containing protein [Marinobacter salarius]|uniref:MaoC/PaaZ C-terminal domain-containing protein n=1 Tax=Marinobacter salarius TaxID=1420917 RepID=UPI00273A8AA9|nr:MaoC/PaaZ C-terminal domain-containing protein [Marinobacter salarius]MDP4534102.1 MaoC/PaaZ C-terminal domain-containing protein [Marinobacter salarius]